MTVRRPSHICIALAVVVTMVVGACGGGGGGDAQGVKQLTAKIPDRVLDLVVKSESIRSAQETKRPFIDGLALYSLRRDELLQATLQISRFSGGAKPDSARFRGSVINQIGSTVPKSFRMGGNTVYLTTGRRQAIAVWFRDRNLFILSMRDEYGQPRRLLRQLLAVQL
jgi:hypothetical protein